MNQLKILLENLIGLTTQEWGIFKNILVKQTHESKTTLVGKGKTARYLYFIDQGLLRTYHLQNGKEINTYFACDKQFISTFASFITQTPSLEYLEVVEDSTVYALSYQGLTNLYTQSSKFEKLGRLLAEKNYLCILDRTLSMQTKTAKEKYLEFIQNYDKKIIQRIPQHHIASFLGIAPESLSRIRKQLSTS